MPQTSGELAWWAFNGVFLLVLWFVKRDLGEIKSDTKENRKLQEENALNIAKRDATCEERHKRLDYEIAAIKK
jgi:hypothetical protein